MELHRFLSLLAAFIGLVGAMFLSKGILALTPKAMLDLTPPHSRIGYSPELIASLAKQKADTIIGVIYIGGAFLIQVVSLISFGGQKPFTESRWMGFWMVLAIVSLVTVIFSLADIKIRDWYKVEMGKIEVRWKFSDTFSRERFDSVNIKELEVMAQELLGLKRGKSETTVDLVKRIARYVEYANDIDVSKIEDKWLPVKAMCEKEEQCETNSEFLEFLNRKFDSIAADATIEELAEFAFGGFDEAVKAFEEQKEKNES